jgi:RHS repeat-associated protein
VLSASAFAQTTKTKTYFHLDPAGTPLMATNEAGAVVWKETYLPYGEKVNNSLAASSNTVGYAGKPYDPATGLSYMGARYYHPTIGRFTGIDPVGFNPDNLHSHNRYAYANNNPYKYVDPDGRSPVAVAFIGAVGISLAVQDAYNGYQSGGWRGAANSVATTGAFTIAFGLAGRATVNSINAVKSAFTVNKTVAVEAAPVSINLTDKGLRHAVQRHTENDIAKFADKSKFNKDVDIASAIKQGEQHPAALQSNGNYARTYDAGKPIGTDRVTGLQTSEMTVITKANGDLVTSFPGAP